MHGKEKAEKQHKLTLLSAAKEQNDELTVLSQELDSKLLELKNF